MIDERLDPNKALDGEEGMANEWVVHKNSFLSQDVYEKSLAEQWRKTGCDADGAPYVLRRLLSRLDNPDNPSPFTSDSPEVPKLAAAFFDKEHCLGGRGLSQAEIRKLKAITSKAPPPAPKH